MQRSLRRFGGVVPTLSPPIVRLLGPAPRVGAEKGRSMSYEQPPPPPGGEPPAGGKNPYGAPQYGGPPAQDPGRTMGIVGLVLAIFCSLIGMIVSIIAYNKSKAAGFKNNIALAGII